MVLLPLEVTASRWRCHVWMRAIWFCWPMNRSLVLFSCGFPKVIVVLLRGTRGVMFSWGQGEVTDLVNTVCSCRSCNYCSWEGTRINHVISLNDRWARQLVASEWCDNSILGWWSIKGALPWWNMAIMMHSEMGWITKRVRSDCHRVKVGIAVCGIIGLWKGHWRDGNIN